MKLKNSVINGLFHWDPDTVFTKGDLLLWGGPYVDESTSIYIDYDLYYVIGDENGEFFNKNPYKESQKLENAECVKYIQKHAYHPIDNNGDNSIVTAASFRSLVESYFMGLDQSGVLKKITVNIDTGELDSYTHTGAWECTVIFNDTQYKGLLRVYTTENNIIQEFIDIVSGFTIIRSRVSNGSIWSVVRVLNANTEFTNRLTEYFSRVQSQMRRANELSKLYRSSLVLPIEYITGEFVVNPKSSGYVELSPLGEYKSILVSLIYLEELESVNQGAPKEYRQYSIDLYIDSRLNVVNYSQVSDGSNIYPIRSEVKDNRLFITTESNLSLEVVTARLIN